MGATPSFKGLFHGFPASNTAPAIKQPWWLHGPSPKLPKKQVIRAGDAAPRSTGAGLLPGGINGDSCVSSRG